MKRRNEMITKTDFLRLSTILDDDVQFEDVAATLEEKLSRAAIIEPAKAPMDLVTMNSKIVGSMLDEHASSSAEQRTMTLVYPREADIAAGRISIMAPLGAELLGVRAGQVVTWRGVDGCARRLVIDQVLYQPEASGDWHL